MTTTQDLLNRLQLFQRTSKIYEEYFKANANQLSNRELTIDDVLQQLSVDTATSWGLFFYEQELGIKTELAKPIEERREIIKARMRGIGTVNAEFIKNVARAFTNGEIDLDLQDGTIKIQFKSDIGTPPNMEDFKKTIEEFKPAHLLIEYLYRYITYAELQELTYAQLVGLTWDKFARRA